MKYKVVFIVLISLFLQNKTLHARFWNACGICAPGKTLKWCLVSYLCILYKQALYSPLYVWYMLMLIISKRSNTSVSVNTIYAQFLSHCLKTSVCICTHFLSRNRGVLVSQCLICKYYTSVCVSIILFKTWNETS